MTDTIDEPTDIANVRRLATERATSDPLAAYALDGCADEIERLRDLLDSRPYQRCGCCGNCPVED